ncbi:MAG: PAC2 family protein, partial [Sulfolobales archaeon]
LFIDEENKLLLLLNHILPYHREWNEYTRGIIRWLKRVKISNAIFIGGLDKNYKSTNAKLSWIKTSKSNINLNYPLMDKYLLVVGPLALLTIYAEIEDIPAIVLLPYAERDRADPAAAAVAIEALSDILSIKVDVSSLYEDAKKIEEELQRQMEILQTEINKGSLGRGGYM